MTREQRKPEEFRVGDLVDLDLIFGGLGNNHDHVGVTCRLERANDQHDENGCKRLVLRAVTLCQETGCLADARYRTAWKASIGALETSKHRLTCTAHLTDVVRRAAEEGEPTVSRHP